MTDKKILRKIPNIKQFGKYKDDSLSPIAPFRILNIGNTKKVYLLDFIKEIEKVLGKKASLNISMNINKFRKLIND